MAHTTTHRQWWIGQVWTAALIVRFPFWKRNLKSANKKDRARNNKKNVSCTVPSSKRKDRMNMMKREGEKGSSLVKRKKKRARQRGFFFRAVALIFFFHALREACSIFYDAMFCWDSLIREGMKNKTQMPWLQGQLSRQSCERVSEKPHASFSLFHTKRRVRACERGGVAHARTHSHARPEKKEKKKE